MPPGVKKCGRISKKWDILGQSSQSEVEIAGSEFNRRPCGGIESGPITSTMGFKQCWERPPATCSTNLRLFLILSFPVTKDKSNPRQEMIPWILDVSAKSGQVRCPRQAWDWAAGDLQVRCLPLLDTLRAKTQTKTHFIHKHMYPTHCTQEHCSYNLHYCTMYRSTHIKIWTYTFSECLSCLHECVVHCTFEVFGACVFCSRVGVCVLCVCTVCACARPRSRFYRHTARPREPSWRAEGAAQGRTLHSDQSVLSKYPLLSICDQVACLCTVGSRWNREFNLIFQKLTSYFQIMHFVWGIFHFPSVSYFPTTSGLS